jgi:hypothetical protein
VDRGEIGAVADVGDDDARKVLSRSWVIGRGVGTFSMIRAMALASKDPIQMGRTRLPDSSSRRTMGIWEVGSVTRPLIFMRISIMGFPVVYPQ